MSDQGPTTILPGSAQSWFCVGSVAPPLACVAKATQIENPMDKQTARQLHQLLAPLATLPWHRATFLADQGGRVLYHFGISDVLKANGEEVANVARKTEASESLYLTGLHDAYFVGVLFDADTEVDRVRDALQSLQPALEGLVQ